MSDLKAFRKFNNLYQKDIAEYLGVTRGFISMTESGRAPLPYNHLRKLLENDKGWDTSMLQKESILEDPATSGPYNSSSYESETAEIAVLRKEIEMLRQQVEELKAEKAEYWATIVELMNK